MLLVVLVPLVPVALVEDTAPAGADAPTAPVEAAGEPLAATEAPVAAPAGLEEDAAPVLVVPVVVVGLAARISMKTTIWPLLDMFRKLPSMAGIFAEELPVELVAELPLVEPVLDVPLAPALPDVANEPVHWFLVSICW